MKKEFVTVTQGKLKGLRIPLSSGWNITPQKVKEALFQILSNHVSNMKETAFVDLYSGSGQIAFEAYSRGIETVTALEIDPRRINRIRKIAANRTIDILLKKVKAERLLSNIDHYIPLGERDIKNLVFFADPPYSFGSKNLAYYEKLMSLAEKTAENYKNLKIILMMQVPFGKKEYHLLSKFSKDYADQLYPYGKNAIMLKIINWF